MLSLKGDLRGPLVTLIKNKMLSDSYSSLSRWVLLITMP
jgi:hypothetical protein